MTDVRNLEVHAHRGFACPYEPFDDSFLDLLAIEYARSLSELFLGRFEAVLGSVGKALADLMVTAGPEAREVAWTPALSPMTTALRRLDPSSALAAAVQFLLDGCASGTHQAWSVELPRPRTLVFEGFVLPETRALDVKATPGSLEIALEKGSLRFERRDSTRRWEADTDRIVRLPVLSLDGIPITILSRQALPELDCGCPLVDVAGPGEEKSVECAFQLYRDRIPEYGQWVARVLRRLILVQSPSDMIQSGNFDGCIGMFYVSSCSDPLLMGEMLVHESSHQYYHCLAQLEEMVDPGDTRTYYSPFVQTERPLDKILLAYHAFANVILYYRKCMETGELAPGRRVGLENLVRDVEAVQQILCDRREVLTPVGRCLFEPLYERMQECLKLPA